MAIEHINEFDTLNAGREKINKHAIDPANRAELNSIDAKSVANQANQTSQSAEAIAINTDDRLDNIIAGEMQDAEVIDARRPFRGEAYATLGERLDESDAQLAQIDYKEINPYEYEDYLENDDWTTVIHKIFEENESGTIQFPIGDYTFRTPIGRIKDGFVIRGVDKRNVTFTLNFSEIHDYFVRAGLKTDFNNISLYTPETNYMVKSLFDVNSNALGVQHPQTTEWFNPHDINYQNEFINIQNDRLPNLFTLSAQNFDDGGNTNNLCSYIMYFFPKNFDFNGINTAVDFKLRQKNGNNFVRSWATEVTFKSFKGTRLKKGFDISIENDSDIGLDSVTDIALDDVSLQGSIAGSYDNENWSQTEFLNVRGDDRNLITVKLQNGVKFWDTPGSGYLEHAYVNIDGQFLHSAFTHEGVNVKEGFILGTRASVNYIGNNPSEVTYKDRTVEGYTRLEPFEEGIRYIPTPSKNGYNPGFTFQVRPKYTDLMTLDGSKNPVNKIRLGNLDDFEISVGTQKLLKYKQVQLNRSNPSTPSRWLGANNVLHQTGGEAGEIAINSDEEIAIDIAFPETYNGVPFVVANVMNAYPTGAHIILRTIWGLSKTGCQLIFKNIGTTNGKFVYQWYAVGGSL